jgi:hypothetical protein
VGDASCLVPLAPLRFLATADAGAAQRISAATLLANVQAAKRIERGRLLVLLPVLLAPLLGISDW